MQGRSLGHHGRQLVADADEAGEQADDHRSDHDEQDRQVSTRARRDAAESGRVGAFHWCSTMPRPDQVTE